MEENIDILKLNPEQQQALVCMFFAMLPKSDARYKKRIPYWEVLQKRFNKKINTYKNAKDAFDRYFPENNRVGWSDDRALSRRGKEFQEIYDLYKDYSVDTIERAVEEIMNLYRNEENLFISLKCGYPDTVHAILRGEKNITIDGVYTLQEELLLDKIVFVTLGGDRGKKEVDWEPGFFGVAHIIKAPYDFGYGGNDKYFKFDICMDCSFGRTYKREEFINYRDAFDARYIGPELTRDPSQAISGLEENKAVAVIRAVLDRQPEMEEDFRKTFSKEFMNRVMGAVRVLISTVAEYGESNERALETFREEKKAIDEYCEDPINFETGYEMNKFSRNRIIFGAPGTGKSFTLNSQKDKLIENGGDYERVTFHPNYSYANFVGTYKPVSKKDMAGNEIIVYEYVPGPFMRIFVKAIENSRNKKNVKPYLLLIEEINRSNVAAVFGEVFQLLDRNSKNVSEYSIQVSEDIKKYLIDTIHVTEDEIKEIRIPDNMFIWATMNSADQGVFPIDTAFKRRWEFEYIGVDDEASKVENYIIPVGMGDNRKYVKWNELRMRINDILLSDECKVNEDKLLGPFFISKNMLENALADEDKFVKAFESKVIMYLFEDVMKMRPANIFKGYKGKMIFSEICNTFEEIGEEIFGIMDIDGFERPMQ
ncbi:MAG: AAA family ATPase [Lachnospiraceae bacterium]|nr:AAA family ATPase [Lachnospiraceae bacterium]